MADTEHIEPFADDLLNVEDHEGLHEEVSFSSSTPWLFSSVLVILDQKMIVVPHSPGGTVSGRFMTFPPTFCHWFHVPHHLLLKPKRMEAIWRSSGLIPRYFLPVMLQGKPALGSVAQGLRKVGGRPSSGLPRWWR